MTVLGSIYIAGSIGPYLSSYFHVSSSQVQTILPATILVQTCVIPIGGQFVTKSSPHNLILVGAIPAIISLAIASLVPRDNFTIFLALWVCGFGWCAGISYMVPI